MTAPRDDLFERARAVSFDAIMDLASLNRAGRRLRGECPICGASQGKKTGGAFSLETEKGLFHCFGCLAGGDVIALTAAIKNMNSRQAAEWLVGAGAETVLANRAVAARPAAARAKPAEGPTTAEKVALELWRDAKPGLIGTLAEVYLRHRGISDAVIAVMHTRLRFHPAAKEHWDSETRLWAVYPAMIGRVSTIAGGTGGVHVTYLARDGRGKARVDMPKRMWGKMADAEGRPGGVWLTDPSGKGPLIVGEGIESTASAGQLMGLPCRMVAALSLGALQGGWKTDNWGRINLNMIEADPERPPFTWPEPKTAPWGEVMIAVDRDMKPVEVKVRKLGGGTVKHRLTADERARICAGLAVQAWKAAGAHRVRAIAPAAGRDFNSELVERVG